MPTESLCVKCGGSMESGYPIDRLGGDSVQSSWTVGLPEPNSVLAGRVRGEELPIVGLRCKECGFLELYAGRR